MRKLITVLAVSSGTAFLCVTPAHADDVVGGPRLATHGYVWDHTAKVPEPPHIQASSYVIADLETGRILAAKNPHGHYRPASTLKTLTAITLIPRLDPAKKVRPSRTAVDASGSAVGLDTHWTYTVRDLFYGLLMQSGNDAAIALSEANGGLRPTLDEMNAEARRIRALDTVARTPNGLDDDPPLTLAQQHSSAYDLALIMKQGLKLPDFRKYVARVLYHWPAPPTKKQRAKGKKTGGWEIGTHDHLLLGDRYPGMIGGKNGWTSHALGSFVGAATRNGHTIIIALMHAQSDFWPDARALLNWGFAERAKVAGVGTLVDPVPPPRPVRSKAAAAPAGAVRATPDDGTFTWWPPVAAGGGAALLAALSGVVIGLRRRHRLSAAGRACPPGPSAPPPADPPSPEPASSDHAPGDPVSPDPARDGSPPGGDPPPAFGSAPAPGGGHVRTIPPPTASAASAGPAAPGSADDRTPPASRPEESPAPGDGSPPEPGDASSHEPGGEGPPSPDRAAASRRHEPPEAVEGAGTAPPAPGRSGTAPDRDDAGDEDGEQIG